MKPLYNSAFTDEESEVWSWEVMKVTQQVIDMAKPGAGPL